MARDDGESSISKENPASVTGALDGVVALGRKLASFSQWDAEMRRLLEATHSEIASVTEAGTDLRAEVVALRSWRESMTRELAEVKNEVKRLQRGTKRQLERQSKSQSESQQSAHPTSPRMSEIRREFHKLFYAKAGWRDISWQGVRIIKNPFDLFTYQDLIYRLQPRTIVEFGAAEGGGALFFAHMLALMCGGGNVVSVSIDDQWHEGVRAHQSVRTLVGNSVDPDIVRQVHELVPPDSPCLVVLDSDHARDHVLAELDAYADLPATGFYLIVEDGNVNGHPVRPEHGPGPYEAVTAFLERDDRYEIDLDLENRFLLTFAVQGFLRRRAQLDAPIENAAREALSEDSRSEVGVSPGIAGGR